MKFPEESNGTEERKDKLTKFLFNMDMYLHERGKFLYFKEDNMPDNVKLENSFLKEGKETSIVFTRISMTTLNVPDRFILGVISSL